MILKRYFPSIFSIENAIYNCHFKNTTEIIIFSATSNLLKNIRKKISFTANNKFDHDYSIAFCFRL